MWIVLAGLLVNKIITEIITKIEKLNSLDHLNISEHVWGWFFLEHVPELYLNSAKIGRASCRERV